MRQMGDGRGPRRCPVARFRTLDPAMRDSPQLDELPLLALLLIDRLIQEADDEGRQYGDPRSVWRAAFPRNNAPAGVTQEDVMEAVETLEIRKIIVRYEVDGQAYIAFPGWKDGDSWQYQNVSRAKPSRFPAPPKKSVKVKARGQGVLPKDRVGEDPLDDPVSAPRASRECAVSNHGELAGDVTGRDETGRDEDADPTRRDSRGVSASAGGAPASPPLPTGSELVEELRRIEYRLKPGRNKFQSARETALSLLTDSRSPEAIAQAQATLRFLRTEAEAWAAKGKNGVAAALAAASGQLDNGVGRGEE